MNDSFDKDLFSITTIIITERYEEGEPIVSTASGFYYNQLEKPKISETETDNKEKLHLVKIKEGCVCLR